MARKGRYGDEVVESDGLDDKQRHLKTHITAQPDLDIQIEEGSVPKEQAEIVIKVESLLDDPEEDPDEETEEEAPKQLRKEIDPAKLIGGRCFLEGKSPAQIAEIIYDSSKLNLSENKMHTLLGKLKKIKLFISDLEINHNLKVAKQPDKQKITILTGYGTNKPYEELSAGEQAWLSYLLEIIKFCYPGISEKRTFCHPLEFREIIIEKLIVPLGPTPGRKKLWGWFEKRGEALNRIMREKMQELVEKRLKQA